MQIHEENMISFITISDFLFIKAFFILCAVGRKLQFVPKQLGLVKPELEESSFYISSNHNSCFPLSVGSDLASSVEQERERERQKESFDRTEFP